MKPYFLIKLFFVLGLIVMTINSPILCLAGSYVINPSDDCYIFYSGYVDRVTYLSCGGNTRGIVEFSLGSISEQIVSATLSINPYGLPNQSPIINMYGYQSSDGRLTTSDFYAGTYLGDWTLPPLGYGQDAYFDVTNFLKTVTTPYVGFNLRADGAGDQFSSLEYNYGHPSQLIISTVPEPATLLVLGLGAAILRKRRK